MKLETLEEFIAIVKCHSFSRAAKALYLSQPSLSAHIAAMEKDLGFALLERGNGKLALTPAGAAFLEYAQTLINTYEEARTAGRAAAKEQPPIKMLGMAPGSRVFKILSVQDNPKITFVDTDYNTTILDALESGAVDIGLCADYTNVTASRDKAEAAHISFVPTGCDHGAIAVMRTNPLAAKTSLTSSDLENATVTISSYAHFDEWKHIVRSMLKDISSLKFHLNPLESTNDLARENLGNSLHICGREAIDQHYLHRDDIVAFDRLDGKDLVYSSGFAYRTDSANKALLPFVERLTCLMRETREQVN